jgi:glycosyltransferase involved in cell wall biosynthesis
MRVEPAANSGEAAKTFQEPSQLPHITVCICTYKRPKLLKRLLDGLSRQTTEGLFTYSIAIADNDSLESARTLVKDFAASSPIPIRYSVEPRRSIALVRNKVLENAQGDFVALVDDDEFPIDRWLVTLLKTCNQYNVDGVLGPVKRHFDEIPPRWLVRSKFYDRRVNPTGTRVDWQEARTGNVLIRREVFLRSGEMPFRPEFRAGEDQDFFRRKIDEGRAFIWSAEAVVYEVVPPARWSRSYMIKKALLRGATASLQPSCGAASIAKSIVAIPAYTIALPFAAVIGHEWFMTYLVRLFDHLGKLLALLKINLIKEDYVNE